MRLSVMELLHDPNLSSLLADEQFASHSKTAEKKTAVVIAYAGTHITSKFLLSAGTNQNVQTALLGRSFHVAQLKNTLISTRFEQSQMTIL